jgi:hypothetical protein
MNTDQQDRIDILAEALQRIAQWSDAYPLDVFPEPDLEQARRLHALRRRGRRPYR